MVSTSTLFKDPNGTRGGTDPIDHNRKRPASTMGFLANDTINLVEGRHHSLFRFQGKMAALYKTQHKQVRAQGLLPDSNEPSGEAAVAPKTNPESTPTA